MSPQHDRELASIYRRASTEEPPPRLDASIYAYAEADAKEADHEVRRWARWRSPFALAATVVLATTVVLMMEGPPESRPMDEAVTPVPVPPPPPPELAAETFSRQVQNAPRASHLPGTLTPHPSQTPQRRDTGTSEPAAPPVQATAKEAAPSERGQFEDRLPPRSRDGHNGAISQQHHAPAVAAASGPPNEASTASRAAAARELVGADMQSESNKMEKIASLQDDPRAWLRHIESLFRQGKEPEARAQLDAFRKKYPNHPVPPGFE